MLAAIQQVYPVEEPEPAGLLPSISLRPYQKHFDNVVDPELKKAKQQELDNAHKVLKQHEKAAAKLQKEVDQRSAVLQEVKGRKSEVDQHMGTMRTMLGRKPALAQLLWASSYRQLFDEEYVPHTHCRKEESH